jgi:hypothetical protein
MHWELTKRDPSPATQVADGLYNRAEVEFVSSCSADHPMRSGSVETRLDTG